MSDRLPDNTVTRFNHFFISGLNNIVRKDDTYKLRFTNEYALRESPDGTNLKNRHTEWVLLRKEQKTRIPRKLWEALIDAACGETVAGAPLPSIDKIDYDRRHGTTTRYGLSAGQVFMDREPLLTSIKHTINNTTITYGLTIDKEYRQFPDEISYDGFDMSTLADRLKTPNSTRLFLNELWTNAKPAQINEIFFDALLLALDKNLHLNEIFKTSWIALHSIKLFNAFDNTSVNS